MHVGTASHVSLFVLTYGESTIQWAALLLGQPLNDVYSVLRANQSLSNVSAARMQSGVGSVITFHGIIKAFPCSQGGLHGHKMERECKGKCGSLALESCVLVWK